MSLDGGAVEVPSRRSRQIVWAALALAALMAALAAAFVYREAGEVRRSQLDRVELYARLLDERTTALLSVADTVLRSLVPAVRTQPAAIDAKALGAWFADRLQDRDVLRSVSLLDAGGSVLAGSDAGDAGQRLAPSLLAGLPPSGRDSRLGPLLAGASLRDLATQAPAPERARSLPMYLPLATNGGPMTLVALIDPDRIVAQHASVLGDLPLRATLLDADGRLIASTSASADERSTAAGAPSLSATHAAGRWPLAVRVEQPMSVYWATVARDARWWGLSLLLSWAVLAAATRIVHRALLHDERMNRDLARAHQATQQSESRKLAILQSALDAIVSVDLDGRVIEFNAAAEQMFGVPAGQALGRPMHEMIVPPQHRAAHQAGMARYRASGEARVLNRRIEIEAQRADGRVFPVELTIVPVRTETGEIFTATLRDLSARRAAEDELAAARQRELAIGARIQQSLLVVASPLTVPGVQFSTFNQASQGVDGDFIEIVRMGPHAVDLITGDVMGKGMGAAMMGAATKLQFSRSIAELLSSQGAGAGPPQPAAVVAAVHRAMTPTLQALEAFVTLCYLRIDTREDTVTWVGCGHEEALLLTADGRAAVLPNQHPPLGVLDDETFQQRTHPLRPGDRLLLCSDGVTDALCADGQRVGHKRLVRTLKQRAQRHDAAAALLHTLRQDLLGSDVVLQDDVTMVLVQRDLVAGGWRRIELPVRLDALRALRGFLKDSLADCGLDDGACGLLQVACVEVFTNIVRHAGGLVEGAPVELRTRAAEGLLTIELAYLGDAYQPPAEIPQTDFGAFPEGGMGLEIIHGASDEVRYLHEAGVNTVRMTRRLA